jgi:hypothetical protein
MDSGGHVGGMRSIDYQSFEYMDAGRGYYNYSIAPKVVMRLALIRRSPACPYDIVRLDVGCIHNTSSVVMTSGM